MIASFYPAHPLAVLKSQHVGVTYNALYTQSYVVMLYVRDHDYTSTTLNQIMSKIGELLVASVQYLLLIACANYNESNHLVEPVHKTMKPIILLSKLANLCNALEGW